MTPGAETIGLTEIVIGCAVLILIMLFE